VSGTSGDRPPIYTKTGDDGTTGLLFGGRVSKADPVIEICGALDEAVAALGLARATLEDARLHAAVLDLLRGLFAVAAEIAANLRAHDRLVPGISSVTAEMTASLEPAIDALVAEHPLRPAFVVPGANSASARTGSRSDLPSSHGAAHHRRARAGADRERHPDRVCEPGVRPGVRARAGGRRRG
jgi:ATP:cob(I)alamin adenosyltransferase